MRYFIITTLLFACLPLWADEPEIVIELTGKPSVSSAKDEIEIWDKNSRQLARLLKGKTREQALYQITSVSTQDVNIWATNGARYRFVQYGKGNNYRKLLFRAKEPQTFVACAANTQESLDMTFEYKVDIGLTETEFLETYAKEAAAVYLPANNGHTLYQVTLPKQEPKFIHFLNGKPVEQMTKAQADQFVKEEQQRVRQAEKQARQKAREQEAKKRRNATRTALLEGGTLHDRMYMPRVIQPNQTLVSPNSNP